MDVALIAFVRIKLVEAWPKHKLGWRQELLAVPLSWGHRKSLDGLNGIKSICFSSSLARQH